MLREAEELGGAGPADQAMRGVLQAGQGVGVAAPAGLDQDRQQLEAAGEAGDEAPAPFVDDFLNLSRRKGRELPRRGGGPCG